MEATNSLLASPNLENHQFKWEIFSSKEGTAEGIRIEAEDVATKEIMLKDVHQHEIATLTHALIDDCRVMLSFLQSAFNSQDTHTTVTIQTVPAGLRLSFEYKTVFKTFAFEILLERQPTNTETRFEQAARSLHQQLVVAQNEIQRLGAENAALKLEIDKVWKVLRSPRSDLSFEPIARAKQQLHEWAYLGTKESFFSMIAFLLLSSANYGHLPGHSAKAKISLVQDRPSQYNPYWWGFREERKEGLWYATAGANGERWPGRGVIFDSIDVCSSAWPFLQEPTQQSEVLEEARRMGLQVKISRDNRSDGYNVGYADVFEFALPLDDSANK